MEKEQLPEIVIMMEHGVKQIYQHVKQIIVQVKCI